MFKNPFQVAVTFAVLALIIKLTVFTLEIQHGSMEKYIFFIYMLILNISVFFGIRSNKIAEGRQTTFGEDFRAGARTASFYAILVAIITYVYYSNIDVHFFDIKRSELIDTYPAKIQNALENATMTLAEIKTKVHADIVNTYTIFTAYFQALITMFGLVFIGLFFSALFAFVMKRMPGFKS
jgi:anaerobic C4-dicarboxylate transporter